MKFKCTNIQWDTDGEQVDLPSSLIVEVDVDDELCEAVSNATGFCHSGFEFRPFIDFDCTKLTDDEYNVLNKIASKSKMDCWFWIETDENGEDFILDLENDDERLSLRDGIMQLCDGMTSCSDYELTADELAVFGNLLIKLLLNC